MANPSLSYSIGMRFLLNSVMWNCRNKWRIKGGYTMTRRKHMVRMWAQSISSPADTRRKQGTRRAHGGQLRRGTSTYSADTRRIHTLHTHGAHAGGQGGHGGAAKADTARTKRRTQGGHMADKLRGRGQSISRPAFFSQKRNPTLYQHRPQTVFQAWGALAKDPKWQTDQQACNRRATQC